MKNYPYIENLIDLIYEHHQNLLPFLDVLRKDINRLEFKRYDIDKTADITLQNYKFNIVVNIYFIDEFKLNNEDILWLICHEISHFILGHLNKNYVDKYSQVIRNIAFDCQVNSMLYNINYRNEIKLLSKVNWTNYNDFLETESSEHFIFLTVPPIISQIEVNKDFSKLEYVSGKLKLASQFWFNNFSESGLGLNEIFNYLEKILPEEEHAELEENSDMENDKNQIVVDDLPEYAKQLIINQNKIMSEMVDDFAEQDNNQASFEKEFDLSSVELKKRKQMQLINAIKKSLFIGSDKTVVANETTSICSIFPSIGRREAAILSSGMLPTFYSNKMETPIKKSLAVYIDFSGSTEQYHKEICKLLISIKDFYNGRYFAFSMKVTEITFDDLLDGNFETSGTYITPVVNHIVENNFKKVLIITDGNFYLPNGKSNAEIYAILLDKENSTKAIEKMGRLKEYWFMEK